MPIFYRKSGGTAEFEFTHFVPYGTECFLIYIERNFEMREKLEEIKKNALDVLQKATDIDALEAMLCLTIITAHGNCAIMP